VIDSKISLVVFTVLFTIIVSTAASNLNVEGINCSDPTSIISEPGDNTTSVVRVIQPANDLVDVFFGCSSSNSIINGIFTALQAGIIIVLLFIGKDLVPFT